MQFGKLAQNAARSATGSVVKAVLCVRKVSSLKNASALAGGDEGNIGSAIENIKSVETALMNRAQASLKGGKVATYNEIKSMAGMNGYIALGLQYNPSSLRLDTTAGLQRSYTGDPGAEGVSKYTVPVSTTLSCELLFDDVNQMDAFMIGESPLAGGLGLSLSSASKIANYALTFGHTFSVQKQMEGLISMVSIPEARHVIFFWSNMCFRGEMTEVSSEYTMFNKKGAPIRGKMQIQIRQGEGAEEQDAAYGYSEEYWQKSFDTAFSNKSGKLGEISKFTNNSLLNLRL